MKMPIVKIICYNNIKTKTYSTSSIIKDISNNCMRYGLFPVGWLSGQNEEGGNVINVRYVRPTLWQRVKFVFGIPFVP